MEYRDSSELQLSEVSRGVQKLTQMIDSWSKAPNLDCRSKYMAKDLLRESLALQESLITIRRMRETSKMMSFRERKFEFGFIKERQVEEEDAGVEECDSLVVGGGIYSLSTNGSSRNHANERKSAIRGKLNPQNLVSIFGNHESASSTRIIEFPTSSSSSLRENSKGLTMRAKAPNLIAKLMGLEKIPSQVVPTVKKEQKNDKNIYKQTLDYKNCRAQSCLSSEARRSHVNEGEEASTIVIMKPLQLEHESKGEEKKKKKKKENMTAELPLKKEIYGDGYKLNRGKAVNIMDKASMELFPKLRTKASVTYKHQRKDPMALHVNKVTILNGKTHEERMDGKINLVPLFPTKRVKEPPVKPDKKLVAANGGAQTVCIRSTTSRKSNLITNGRIILNHSTTHLMEEDKKKVEKMHGRSKNIKCKGVGKRAEPTNKTSDCCKSFSTSSINGFPHQLVEDSKLGYGESARRLGSKSFCEVRPKAKQKAAKSPDDKTLALKEAAWSQKDIQLLLLTSSTFLTKAEELFGFNVHMLRTKSHQNDTFEEFGARNPQKLLLGCAMELMDRKSCQLELLQNPIWRNYRQNSELLISSEQLAEDISNGVKELNGYCRTAGLEDDLYLRLERDLCCKDMFLNGLWDFGWIGWVCAEEFGAVVEEIEELIICGMIGEVAVDLVH